MLIIKYEAEVKRQAERKRGQDPCGTTQCRMAATQTTLQDKLCFIHVHAVTQKALRLKAVRADSQLFIKLRNVS